MTVGIDFFKNGYDRELFVNDFLDHFLEDGIKFSLKKHEFAHKVRVIKEAWEIGKSPKLNLHVFEIHHASENDPRITLAKEAFLLMQENNLTRALMIFVSDNSPDYRFSLLTIDRFLEKTRVQYTFSNPKRYSYFLGPEAKVKTPFYYLVKKGPLSSFEELTKRFSVEVVNKEFFNEIGGLFNRLVGGKRKINTKTEDFGQGELKYPSSEHRKQQEFAVRLIGRIIFLWFLKKKGGDGTPLIPDAILSKDAVKNYKERFSKNGSYYHDVLEPLFFEVLRYEQSKRKERVRDEYFEDIPFLNGGLFEPHDDDCYDVDEHGRSKIIGNFNIPDSWFSDFFEILETYNFTIDENTEMDIELSVDPEMLGRIFENLLAEINPETQESARKTTGSYYTPRPIVNFMVDESLRAYLKENVSIDHDLINFLFDVALSEEDVKKIYNNKEDREKIIIALDKIKILDPACGSGAFPMGVMQKIVGILQTIDPDNKIWKEYKFKENSDFIKENIDYLRKIGIIRDNIYGVDIQPMAVEISKLRFFLSLIVDEDLASDKMNKGLKPLPNLDFKFACANTLIDIQNDETQLIGEEKEEYEKNLNDLKSSMKKYFTVSDNDEKKRIQKDIESIVDAIIETKREHFEDLMRAMRDKKALSKSVSKKDSERLPFLRSQKEMWESYKNIFKDEAVLFFNTALLFPDVESGFDIVIGNPPYIQLQKFKDNPLQRIYQDQGYEVYNSMGDIYALFYEKGLNLLQENGLLTFITSNKWMRAGYGEKLRQFFARFNPLILIDLGPGVFESTVDTNALVIQKSENRNNLKAVTITKEDKNIPDISDFLSNNGVQLGEVSTDPWFIGNRAELRLKEKIERIGKPLKDWDVDIYYGIKTGLNEAFIIDTPTKERLCEEDPKSEEILKPILRGRDIKRYSYNWAGVWLIQSGYDIDVPNKYPAIYRHLLRFEQKARKRQDQGANWWNLRACAYYPEFEKEKIFFKAVGRNLTFAKVEPGIMLTAPASFLTGNHLEYILGVLCSKYTNYYVEQTADKTGAGDIMLSLIHI